MRRLLAAWLFVLVAAAPLAAQTVTVRATDPSTGANTNVGDASNNAFRVNCVIGCSPVAATQSGTWTVQPGNTANTTAWLVTGTGGVFPATQSGVWNITNITGTISLPTGAATAANQTNASQKTQIVDGSGNVIGSTSNAVDINIKSGNPTTIAVTQGTASSLNATVVGTGTFATQATLQTGSNQIGHLEANQSVNLAQVAGGTTALAGDVNNASAITNTQDVAPVARYDSTQPTLTSGRWNLFQVDSRGSLFIAKGAGGFSIDNTSFAATQSGTWNSRTQDGAGNALTSNSSTYSAKFALDMNLLGTLGTAFSTAGKVDVKGADGDVFIRQSTASNLNAQVVGAAASGASKAGNPVQVGGVFNTTQPTVTTGQAVEAQYTARGAAIIASGTDAVHVTVDSAPSTTVTATNLSVNVNQVNGATPAGIAQLGVYTFGSKVTLTTTNFTSLANGSAWQSVAITTSGIRDVILRVQTKGQTSGTNYVDFYVCTSISSDSTYTDGCTGSEGTFTAANRLNARYLCSIKGNAATAVQGMCNLSDVYAVLPGKFAFIAINNTGAAMSTTAGDHVFDYETVK